MVKTDRRLKMENETPKYATWIPLAGGYVYDGNVVSKDPQYDEKGNFLMDVNGSAFTQSKQTTQPQVANQPTTNVGITTANTQGSGTDVNAPITGAGSLGSLSENTSKSQTGTLGTNAINSPVTGNIVGDFEDRWNKDYDYMVATNNLQGQINLLTERSQRTGEDFTATIDNLTKQREQKIRNIDDQYLAAYNEAVQAGDPALAAQIQEQQLSWRDSVGYQNAMQSAKQREENDLQIKWQDDYIKGINEIANTVLNLTGNLLNFQYNPYTDQALLMAQGQATARIKEQMNATGMYYSSMTVSAITKTCAELIPVYEKMAKQEIIDNINALQSTANFLMNLEQSQFNLWKGQIEMQYKANEEKRKEVDAAWERANMMGYIDNAASAVLGVPAGSLSPNERARLQSIQDQIAKENRALQQDLTLAGYKADLEIARMREQNRLNKDYYAFQVLNPKPGSSNPSSITYAQALTTAKAMFAAGASDEEVQDYLAGTGLGSTELNSIWLNAKSVKKADDKKALDGLKELTPDEKNAITDLDVAKELDQYKKDGDKSSEGQAEFIDSIATNYGQDGAEEVSSTLSVGIAKKIANNAKKYNNDFSNNLKLVNDSIEEINRFSKMIDGTKYYMNADTDKAYLWNKLIDSIFGEVNADENGNKTLSNAKSSLEEFDFEFSDMPWENFKGTQEAARKHILDAIEKSTGSKTSQLYIDASDRINERIGLLAPQAATKPSASTSSLTEKANQAKGTTSTPTPNTTAPKK